ncbi:MAG: hypothetical protein ACI9HY_002912, partial [Planctomycetaceae bacterium]
HADTELETCFKPLYDHVRGKTIGLRLTTGTYTEIFTPSSFIVIAVANTTVR